MGDWIYVGADGCKEGRWIMAATDGRGAWEIDIHDSLAVLDQALGSARRVLLDVPIGLTNEGTRACDVLARGKLAPKRSSSVYPAPQRWMLQFDLKTKAGADAEKRRRHSGDPGRVTKVCRQTLALAPRVLEADQFLRADGSRPRRFRECHPEICFWGLSGRAMAVSKKKQAGIDERLRVLGAFVPDAASLLDRAMSRWPRSWVAADDVIDALVAAVCAAAPEDEIRTLPERPERDECGLAMEMVYRVPRGL